MRDEVEVAHLTDEVDEVVIVGGDGLRARPFKFEGEIGGDGRRSYVEIDLDLSAPRFEELRAYVNQEASVAGEINFRPRDIPHDGLDP